LWLLRETALRAISAALRGLIICTDCDLFWTTSARNRLTRRSYLAPLTRALLSILTILKNSPIGVPPTVLPTMLKFPDAFRPPNSNMGNMCFPIMVNLGNEGTCLTRGLGAAFSCQKNASSLIYVCKMHQNSVFTLSGGRPIIAFIPLETMGRSIKMGFSVIN